MPPPDLQDDYDDEPNRSTIRFPAGVRIAGIIWIAFGALGLLAALISLVSSLFAAPGQGPAPDFCAPACVSSIAVSALIFGVQTVKGTSKSLGGNGVASIGLGIFLLVVTTMLFTGGLFPARDWTTIVLVGSIYSMVALSLVTAGFLALIGKSAYEQWREANGLNRPRQPTPEEEDYDDERRPRRDLNDPE